MAKRRFYLNDTVLLNIRSRAVQELFLGINEQQKLSQMLLVGEVINIRYFNGTDVPF